MTQLGTLSTLLTGHAITESALIGKVKPQFVGVGGGGAIRLSPLCPDHPDTKSFKNRENLVSFPGGICTYVILIHTVHN